MGREGHGEVIIAQHLLAGSMNKIRNTIRLKSEEGVVGRWDRKSLRELFSRQSGTVKNRSLSRVRVARWR